MLRFLFKTRYCFFLLLFCFGAVLYAQNSFLDQLLAKKHAGSDHLPVPKGELFLFPLSSDYFVVAGLYSDFFDQEILRIYRTRLTMADKIRSTGLIKEWSYRFLYNFATLDATAIHLPTIRDHFQDRNYFQISVNQHPAEILQNGYWINAIGSKRTPYASKTGTAMTNSAELVPFAYLKLKTPLQNGDRLTVRTQAGETGSFVYEELKTISRAIKHNQVGYAVEAGKKYAYLGMWLGSLGAMDLDRFIGAPFHIRRQSDDQIVFTGKMSERSKNQSIQREGRTIPLDGEQVLEMDFSTFKEPGSYYLHVPGVGRSWDFIVGDHAIGRAFYVQMRGLFHQRSGIEKTLNQTRWVMKKDHPVSYRGGFIPNDRHYRGESGRFTDAKGNKVDLKHFDMVKATASNQILPNVYGGWWDAGDFDRRTYHFAIVDALLSVYLLFPDHFSDSQLDLPESGNQIPDIIDEAAWGVDLWRRAQNEDGGVGCWLEATSHPENPDPNLDVQRYYLAVPTRESTLQYATYAAKLARAYRKAGAQKNADLFFQSAIKAWRFAIEPKNNAKTTFTHPTLGQVTYSEPENLPPENLFKAALNLYLYDREEEYAKVLDAIPFQHVLETAKDAHNAYFLSELVETTIPYLPQVSRYRNMIRKRANELLQSQEELAYRNINWRMDSPFFLFLAWGAGLPMQKGSFLIMAWYIDGKPKYRDAALLCFDWMLGANPMGRSLTTGLGKVYPVRILSLPMWAWRDSIVDPIPGITLYTFSGMNEYSAANMIFRYSAEARPDHAFAGCNINMLPKTLSEQENLSSKECYRIIQDTIPVWRRFANLEGYAVKQNEFSVWETIAPAAAAYGALLSPGWKPPKDWKDQEPEPDIKKIPGYIFLP